jgi:hypothetical protein
MTLRTLITVLLLASGISEATTRKVPLVSEIVGLGRLILLYHEHHGKYPQSWEEFESVFPGLDERFPELNPTKRMALVSPPIEFSGRCPGLAVAISRDAFRPLGWSEMPIIGGVYQCLEDPSYAVAVLPDGGGAAHCRLSPVSAKSVFDKAGRALPAPSGLGAFAHEKRVMVRRAIIWIAVAGISSWLIWHLIRRLNDPRSR